MFDVPFDEIYQFAAEMAGLAISSPGEHDADVMHNSATINLNVLDAVRERNKKYRTNKTKIFYSSSACMYPEHNQLYPDNPNCKESSAYPANPDSEYWIGETIQ
jgi:nucleoside-diphosphate-sugar epimerase